MNAFYFFKWQQWQHFYLQRDTGLKYKCPLQQTELNSFMKYVLNMVNSLKLLKLKNSFKMKLRGFEKDQDFDKSICASSYISESIHYETVPLQETYWEGGKKRITEALSNIEVKNINNKLIVDSCVVTLNWWHS